MELIIIKNGTDIVGRTNDETEGASYSLMQVSSLPEYPSEEIPKTKYWNLELVDGTLTWVLRDRQLNGYADAVNGLNILGVR